MTAALFYSRPVPLDRKIHNALRLSQSGYRFAAVNSAPLAGTEMVQASRSFPVLFADVGEGVVMPIALMGLRSGENLFVENGAWETGRYVPAYIRRYPFLLTDNLTVCIDVDWEGFNPDSGKALFEADGSDSAFLRETLVFLRAYQGELQNTRRFVERLQTLGLLQPAGVRVQERGGDFQLNGLMRIEPQVLAALSDAQTLALVRSGEMAWIHAHLTSLLGLEELLARRERRLAASDEAPATSKPKSPRPRTKTAAARKPSRSKS